MSDLPPIYVPIETADFHAIGYERRDECTEPRILITGFPHRQHVTFHRAGEQYVRLANILDFVRDSDLVAGLCGSDALRLGYEWGARVRPASQAEPAE